MRSPPVVFAMAKRVATEALPTAPAAEGAMGSFAFVLNQAAVPGSDDAVRGGSISDMCIVTFV